MQTTKQTTDKNENTRILLVMHYSMMLHNIFTFTEVSVDVYPNNCHDSGAAAAPLPQCWLSVV